MVAHINEAIEAIDDNRYYGRSTDDGRRLLGQARVFNRYTEELLRSSGIAQGSLGLAVDLGCGPAATVPCLEPYAQRIIGVDNDDVKLTQAASVVETSDLRGRVKLMHADASVLPSTIPSGSVELVYMRLFLEHLDQKTREGVMEQIARITTPQALIVAEDFDLRLDKPTWISDPQSLSHRRLHEAMVGLYEARGADPGMGPRLVSLFEQYGWKAKYETVYTHKSGVGDSFTPFHYAILDAMRVPLIRLGIVTPEDFSFHRQRFEEDLKVPETNIYTPRMHQVVATRR